MNTRSFIILLILIPLLLLGGAALYFLGPWGQDEDQEQTQSKIEVLVSEPVISPILSFNGERVWYMTREGRMFRVPLPQSLPPAPTVPSGPGEGKENDDSPPSMGGDKGRVEEYLLPEPVEGVIKITWPFTGNDFIVELPGRFALYDSAAKKFHSYPLNLQKPAFLADPSKIIYDWTGAQGQHELKVSDKNGENFRKIADLRRPDYEIVPSPAREEVVLFGSDNLEPSYLILVNIGTGEFKDIDEKNLYSGAKFSPDGGKLAALKNNELVVYDLDFANNSPSPPLTLRGGWGALLGDGQIVWSADSKSIIIGTRLGFFKYDLASGQQSEIYKFKEGENYEPSELILHPTKNLLFFSDGKTGYLHLLLR